MRYRFMATYIGVPYHAGLGPDGTEVTLFSPGPPPEDLGFTRMAGYWRKSVGIHEITALWQSRLVGEYRGERCLVLDDLGDRLHIAFLGRDAARARQLGYWEIDREVFEVVVARQEVVGLTEERVDFPLTAATFPPSAGFPPSGALPGTGPFPAVGTGPLPTAATGPLPAATGPLPAATGPFPAAGTGPFPAAGARFGERTGPQPAFADRPGPPPGFAERTGPQPGFAERTGPQPGFAERTGPPPGSGERDRYDRADRPAPTPDRVAAWHGSPAPEPWPVPPSSGSAPSLAGPAQAPLGAHAAPPPGRRTGRRDRVSPQAVFAELLMLAGIPQTAYAVEEEVSGAMCVIKADGGFEVFSRTDDARLDVRFFEDEEAAYFYLFGVLAAEAVRSGRLGPLGPMPPNGYHNGSHPGSRPGGIASGAG